MSEIFEIFQSLIPIYLILSFTYKSVSIKTKNQTYYNTWQENIKTSFDQDTKSVNDILYSNKNRVTYKYVITSDILNCTNITVI